METETNQKHTPTVEPVDDVSSDTAHELRSLGITPHQHISYEWNGFRYSNASDAIAAAKRARQ